MPFSFDPHRGLIVVWAELGGPAGSAVLRLAVDTGATWTVVNAGVLASIGYTPAAAVDHFEVTTASGVASLPRLRLREISTLGQRRTDFPVLCHTLPPATGVDGLLGVDFLRGRVLTIDFREGRITLA